jgi:uncharacterized protein YjiS (DUF1127 family)
MLNYPVVPASQSRPLGATSSRISAVLVSAATAAAWIVWRRYRRWKTARELHALDDRMLHDIGLDRSEIDSVVTSGFTDRRAREVLGR